MIFSLGICKVHLNLLMILCRKTSISTRAYSFPKHIRGPPPKGTYEKGIGPAPSNLDGSKVSVSGKKLGSACVEAGLQYNCRKRKEKTDDNIPFLSP